MPYEDWAALHFNEEELGQPSISGVTADVDKDGVSNGLEYVFGSDPRYGKSTGAITLTSDPGRVSARFPVNPQAIWQVERTIDLQDWEPYPDFTFHSNGVMGRIDLDPAAGREFYIRLVAND